MRTLPLEIEASVGSIASGQYGLITADEAISLGLSRDAIRRRVRAGAFIPMAPSIFRVVGAPRSWQQRAMAVALWVVPHGAVAGASAAALHRLDGFGPPTGMEVLVVRSMKAFNSLVKVRVTPFLLDVDRGSAMGIPVTSVERTLIDVARSVSDDRLEMALEDALRRRLTTASKVSQRLADLPPNLVGRARLNRLLEVRGAAPPAESALEVRVIRLLREHGYPAPIRQKVLNDDGRFVGRVDLVFPERRLIIEVDSFRFHSGRVSWEKDRQRRNALSALGWLVIHATAEMLRGRPCEEFLRDLARAYTRPI